MQNESTPDARGPVFCGVDTHADSHWLYVVSANLKLTTFANASRRMR